MLKILKTKDSKLVELSLNNIEEGSWINLIKPTTDEITEVAKKINIDADYLRDALDVEERSRIEIDDNIMLIITNIPIMEDEDNFDALPLGVILTPDYMITVSLSDNKVLSFYNQDTEKLFDTNKAEKFLFQILFRSSKFYLRYLEFINKRTEKIEVNLQKTMKNKALFQLFEMQKSLVYFTTALKNNGIVLEKLMRLKNNPVIQHLFMLQEEDVDILEDVIIENKQALDMVEMHRNILESMIDAFASIISNNLNIVMKFLTSITIILAVPTMLSSFWGMNVNVPLTNHPHGFAIIVVAACILSVIIAYKFWKKGMF
ncbi:MAG: magnesium transporter CorA family protein [Candidatus Gastranaerophilales bacterium]|nr:magnesium transporter CorA family protein [Candidatus Gastranaerophilales bacterium]